MPGIPARFEAHLQASSERFSLESLLSASARVVRDTLVRTVGESVRDRNSLAEDGVSATVPPPPPYVGGAASPALGMLRQVVEAINTGKSLAPSYEQLSRLIHAQEKRAEVIDHLLLTNDYERVINFAEARARIEQDLLTAVYSQHLNPTERMALYTIISQLEKEARGRIKAGSTNVNDIIALLEKIDYSTQAGSEALVRKFADTTPQGREIIRKVTSKLSKTLRESGGTSVED